jgi:glycosyltransferase involved in cell wall biosynthesis
VGRQLALAMSRLSVWILQTGEPLPTDPGNPRPMRAMNLASVLVKAGHQVVLWSADFIHQEKRHRTGASRVIRVSDDLEIRLIGSPGYKSNISFGRLLDHALLASNLRGLLRREVTLPNVGFVGYPPIEAAAVMTRWLASRGVPTLLDVKDQWPSLLLDPLPDALRPLGRAVLAPYYHLARRTMRDATGLSAMSGSFLDWALRFAGRSRSDWDMVVPLTSEPSEVEASSVVEARVWWDAKGVYDDGDPKVCFVGSHSRAFDFRPVADAVAQLGATHPLCQFIICGHGECSDVWRAMVGDAPNTVFTGWIDRSQMSVLFARSSAMLAPYRDSEDFKLSVPNKVIDALAHGLPVLSPLQGEVANLIEVDEVGLRYKAGPGGAGSSLADCVRALSADPALQGRLAINARAAYQGHFKFDDVYGGLVEHLESLAVK